MEDPRTMPIVPGGRRTDRIFSALALNGKMQKHMGTHISIRLLAYLSYLQACLDLQNEPLRGSFLDLSASTKPRGDSTDFLDLTGHIRQFDCTMYIIDYIMYFFFSDLVWTTFSLAATWMALALSERGEAVIESSELGTWT